MPVRLLGQSHGRWVTHDNGNRDVGKQRGNGTSCGTGEDVFDDQLIRIRTSFADVVTIGTRGDVLAFKNRLEPALNARGDLMGSKVWVCRPLLHPRGVQHVHGLKHFSSLRVRVEKRRNPGRP